MSDIETIGQRIKQERLRRSMTQRELAALIGVGVPHVSKVEAGRENPSDELLAQIARTFECDLDELMLLARRVPADLLDKLAADPNKHLAYFRALSDDD